MLLSQAGEVLGAKTFVGENTGIDGKKYWSECESTGAGCESTGARCKSTGSMM